MERIKTRRHRRETSGYVCGGLPENIDRRMPVLMSMLYEWGADTGVCLPHKPYRPTSPSYLQPPSEKGVALEPMGFLAMTPDPVHAHFCGQVSGDPLDFVATLPPSLDDDFQVQMAFYIIIFPTLNAISVQLVSWRSRCHLT